MPIEIWTGQQGAGKTYAMVAEAILPCLRNPRWLVLSNLDVTDWKTKRRTTDVTSGDGSHRVIDFGYVAKLINENLQRPEVTRKNILLAVDEIGLAMPTELRGGEQLMEIIGIVLQMRKSRVDFVGTVQHFDRGVKVLKDNCAIVHQCRIFARTWLWWRRDINGPMNRRTGKPYKLVWLFEVDSTTPNGVGLAPDSPRRRRESMGGFRKLWFKFKIARCYDTYQRQAADTTGSAGGSADLGAMESIAEDVVREAARTAAILAEETTAENTK